MERISRLIGRRDCRKSKYSTAHVKHFICAASPLRLRKIRLAGDEKATALCKNVTRNRNHLCFRINPKPKEIKMFTNRLLYLLIVAVVIAAVPITASAQTGLNPPPPSWYICKDTGSGDRKSV